MKTDLWIGRYYIAESAQRKTDDRRRLRPRRPHRLSYEPLWAWVTKKLGCGWSPLLISGRPRVLLPNDAAMRVCLKIICQWVYSDRSRRELWAHYLPRVYLVKSAFYD